MPWQLLRLQTSPDLATELEQVLQDARALSVTLSDARDQPVFQESPGETPLWDDVVLCGLFEADQPLEPLITALQGLLPESSAATLRIETLADQDWERAWMRDFRPMRFGHRLWVCPSWSQPPDPDGINVILDPGLAFGTGTHPTTALCLEWLDAAALEGKRVIDYGCGTGVLAIAAALSGAHPVLAVDNDPQALQACIANRDVNHILAENLRCCLPEQVDDQQLCWPADILLANILAGPLQTLAPRFASLLQPGGHLVLSGTLPEQSGPLLSIYKQWFDMDSPCERAGWTRLCGIRRYNS